jgi:hypothetical protein
MILGWVSLKRFNSKITSGNRFRLGRPQCGHRTCRAPRFRGLPPSSTVVARGSEAPGPEKA